MLTNRRDLCSYYQQNSQNIQSRYACTFNSKTDLIKANQSGVILPNTKEACEVTNEGIRFCLHRVFFLFSRSTIHHWILPSPSGVNIRSLINQHRNVTHQHIHVRITWVTFVVLKWRSSIGPFREPFRISVSCVFGAFDHPTFLPNATVSHL